MEFPTTRWSVVLALKSTDPLRCREALGFLCEAYWYPLYVFARRRGQPHEEAADLTQAFFLQLLEKDTLQRADAARGRLRSFLLGSFKNFLANVHDHRGAQKRGGRWLRVEIDAAVLGERYDRAQPDPNNPERAYQRQWALTVVTRAMDRLKTDERARGRGADFDQLSVLLTDDAPQHGYRHAADALGKSEGAVRVEVHRLRKRFATKLRQEVAATVASSDDVEEELRALLDALA
jgi:RNA polymerase sigma factor (sigma-70 family)